MSAAHITTKEHRAVPGQGSYYWGLRECPGSVYDCPSFTGYSTLEGWTYLLSQSEEWALSLVT